MAGMTREIFMQDAPVPVRTIAGASDGQICILLHVDHDFDGMISGAENAAGSMLAAFKKGEWGAELRKGGARQLSGGLSPSLDTYRLFCEIKSA